MTEHALPEEDRIKADPESAQLWFGLLGAPVAWAVHFMAAYLLMEAGCSAGLNGRTIVGLNAVTAGFIGATLLALLVTAVAGLAARRVAARTEGDDDARERNSHLGRAGMLGAVFFAFVTLFEGAIVLVVPVC